MRGSFQIRLLNECVWEGHYRSLLSADWKEPLEPDAIAWLSGQVNKPAKKTGQKASAAPSAMEAVAVEVPEAEEQGDGELPEPDPVSTGKAAKKKGGKKTKSSGYGSSGRRRSDDSGRIGLIVVLVVIIAVIIGGIVVFLKFGSNKKDGTQTETPAEKTEPKKDPPKTDPNQKPKTGKDGKEVK